METRRIVLDGELVSAVRDGDELVAPAGPRVPAASAAAPPPRGPPHRPVTAPPPRGGDVARPRRARYLNYEGEIAIVIGRECRHVAPDEADAYVGGYTIANDFGLHDFRDTDAGSMLRVKGSDTLCPIGPGLVDDWDFRGKTLRTLVHGR